jgi:hypothetical protein
VTGLPESAKPKFNLQLSSPIESKTIQSLYDDENPDEDATVTFMGVAVDVATLVVEAFDEDIPLGTSAVHDVKPLCEIDILKGEKKKVSELEVAIVPSKDEVEEEKMIDNVVDAPSEEGSEVIVEKEEVDSGISSFEDVAEESEKIDSTDANAETEEIASEKSEAQDVAAEESGTAQDIAVEESETAQDIAVEESGTAQDIATETATDNDGEGTNEESQVEDATAESQEKGSDGDSDEQFEDAVTEEEEEVDKPKANDGDMENTEEETKAGDNETKDEEPESKDEGVEEITTNTDSIIQVPTCSVHFRIEYESSVKDQTAILYDLLNSTTKRKAASIDKLRRCAASLSRTKGESSTAITTNPKPAVKPGFLNKKSKKDPIFLVRWYNKTIGPQSMLRQVFPIAKNYILFFGGVALMHFQGHQLSLPPPV